MKTIDDLLGEMGVYMAEMRATATALHAVVARLEATIPAPEPQIPDEALPETMKVAVPKARKRTARA